MKPLLLLFLLTLPAFPQFPRLVRFVTSNPTGACGASYITQNTVTGVLTGCVGGTWTTIGGGTGTPGGSDTQIQYNNAGAFGGLAASIFARNSAAWTAGAFAYDFTAGTVSLPAPWVKTTVANTYTAGAAQTFVPHGSNGDAGLIISGAGIPTGISAGGRYTTAAGRAGAFDGTNVYHYVGVLGSGTTAPSAPGVGLAHFAGSVFNVTSSQVVSADLNITTTTCTYPSVLTAIGATGLGTCTVPTIPQNSKSAPYTTVLGDAGQHIYHPSTDNNARTFTIDSNANVAYPVGTAITFVNYVNTVTIAITSDTMFLAGNTATTGSRTLAAGGIATAMKLTSTLWIINGTGLT